MSQNILEVMILKIIRSIKDAGYPDPTDEDIGFTKGNTRIKFRLYTEDKWKKYLQSKNDAGKLASKLGVGEKPDYIVKDENTIYYVKLIKE